jgi:hypothetical protein
MAAEKLLRMCSTNWEAYHHLPDRVHDAWLPDNARQQLRQVIKTICECTSAALREHIIRHSGL